MGKTPRKAEKWFWCFYLWLFEEIERQLFGSGVWNCNVCLRDRFDLQWLCSSLVQSPLYHGHSCFMTHVAYFKQKLFPFSDLQLRDGSLAPERWGVAMKIPSGQRLIRAHPTKKKKQNKKPLRWRNTEERQTSRRKMAENNLEKQSRRLKQSCVPECCGCGRSPGHSYPEVIKHISDLCVAPNGMVTRWLIRTPIWWCSVFPLFPAIHGHKELEPSRCL